jgi:uncharacterized protein YuzE
MSFGDGSFVGVGMRLKADRTAEPPVHVYDDFVCEFDFKGIGANVEEIFHRQMLHFRMRTTSDEFPSENQYIFMVQYNSDADNYYVNFTGGGLAFQQISINELDVETGIKVKIIAKGNNLTAYMIEGDTELVLSVDDANDITSGSLSINPGYLTHDVYIKDLNIYALTALKDIKLDNQSIVDFDPDNIEITADKIDGSKPAVEAVPIDPDATITYDDVDEDTTVITVDNNGESIEYTINFVEQNIVSS